METNNIDSHRNSYQVNFYSHKCKIIKSFGITIQKLFLLRKRKNTVNPGVRQYVMCHSDAQITMNVYNHIAEKSHVENEMSKMNLQETVPAAV